MARSSHLPRRSAPLAGRPSHRFDVRPGAVHVIQACHPGRNYHRVVGPVGGLSLRYVIVGNGIAGTEAALLLRRRDARAEITIVSSEHDHLFSRPALMYVLGGQLRLQDTEPFDRKLYQRLRIQLVRGRAA